MQNQFPFMRGPLLSFVRALCLFGTVLVGLQVGFPLGAFLLMVMLLSSVHLCLASNEGDGSDWISGPGGGVKRVRLNRKTPAHLVRHGIWGIRSRPWVWKRLRVQDHSGRYHADAKARRVHQDDGDHVPVQDRTGVGWGHLAHAQAHVSRLCMFLDWPSCVARVSGVDIHTHNALSETTTTKLSIPRVSFFASPDEHGPQRAALEECCTAKTAATAPLIAVT